jgi:hypothetical protein
MLNRGNDLSVDAKRRSVSEASELLVRATTDVSKRVVVRLWPFWTRFASANSLMYQNSEGCRL